MSAWLENRPRNEELKLECWPGKGRKSCPNCKAIIRSNSILCKKCKHSFEEVEVIKKVQVSIVWPQELRRARNESSRRAAEVRRKNRERAIATGEWPKPNEKKIKNQQNVEEEKKRKKIMPRQ